MRLRSSLDILLVPNLRSSAIKASRIVEDKDDIHALFLSEPQDLERYVRRLVRGQLSFEVFVEQVKSSKLVPEPIGGWLYTSEPILRSLSRLHKHRSELAIFCYRDTETFQETSNVATKIAMMTYRSSAVGKIEAKEWVEAISELSVRRREAIFKEAQYIESHAGNLGNLCLSGLDGRELMNLLSRAFEKINIRCVEGFYRFTPIQMLQARLSRSITEREVEELVKCHLEYVNRYVLRSENRDVAHYRWTLDKEPWLRNRIHACEVEQMKVL